MLGALILLAGLSSIEVSAQEWGGEWAWSPLFEHDGVEFTYIYYAQRDRQVDSVVIRLHNRNDYDVRYEFRVIFRSGDGDEIVEEAQGELEAGEMKTGEADGLYWIPFRDGKRISEVGLRGYDITPI